MENFKMTKTNVRKHKRKGTRGVKAHKRSLKEKVPQSTKSSTKIKSIYRYYLTNRPPSIGTHPKGEVNREATYSENAPVTNWSNFGYVEYENPLTQEQLDRFELFEDKFSKTDPRSPEFKSMESILIKKLKKDGEVEYESFTRILGLSEDELTKFFNNLYEKDKSLIKYGRKDREKFISLKNP